MGRMKDVLPLEPGEAALLFVVVMAKSLRGLVN